MAKLRKLWSTTVKGSPVRTPHDSKVSAYNHITFMAHRYAIGSVRTRYMTVWVDERDGNDWQAYERVNLAEIGTEVSDGR